MTPVYLTPKELAERWRGKISVQTLANWRVRGYGPAYTKLGNRVLYSQEAVEAFERSSERGA